MSTEKSAFAEAAEHLTRTLQRETRAAQIGALAELTEASAAKRAAFTEFSSMSPTPEPCETRDEEQDAIRALLLAANENAVVLEGVKAVLDDMSNRLHELLGSVADPGVYQRFGAPAKHVFAARINAVA